MDQKIVGIVGAVAGLATLDATQGAAAAAPNPQGFADAKSYAELLEPIPNAVARLQAAESAAAQNQGSEMGNVELAQYYHHHHHHHHHHRYYHHHHHHHHFWRRFYHHHHHHHHHHNYRRYY